MANELQIPWAGDAADDLICLPGQLANADIVANTIQSLYALDHQVWAIFFEQASLVEQILRTDPVQCYEAMDFETRDHYRDTVQELAARSDSAELDVAEQAIDLARNSDKHDGASARQHHVGYYLVGDGRQALEKQIGYRRPLLHRLGRGLTDRPTAFYLGAIGLLTLLLMAAVGRYAWRATNTNAWMSTAILAVTLLPLISVAVPLVNSLVARFSSPSLLPKLDFSERVPADSRTIIVIPAMLTSKAEVDQLLQQAEQHHLGNMDRQIDIALLTDFDDAAQASMLGDDALVAQAAEGIDALNSRYGDDKRQPFYLFHRERRWNPAEGVWMGWERKRGKLDEFNRLLRGDRQTSYRICVGQIEDLSDVRYVITLDADTELPPGSAHRLIGALAHPLNRAEFDSKTNKVTAGYAILQPRTEIGPSLANRTRFSRIFSGDTGIDLYTLAVSDVYQDLFDEGIFVGKGIYDVDAFMRTLQDRVPENSLLSHDLFEGIHGRAGLVSDVVVYEDYPASYLVQARRLHRWIRGDWQLLPWLGRSVPHAVTGRTRSTFSAIDRWKIADNLRRSLLMPAILLLLVVGWLWLPGSPLVWTGIALTPLLLPLLISFVTWLTQAIVERTWDGFSQALRYPLLRALLNITFLPHSAYLAVDAILRTLIRVYATRRRLLQWTTAAQIARIFRRRNGPANAWAQMIGSPLVAMAIFVAVTWLNPSALPVALPFLLAWLLAPQIAYAVSRERILHSVELTQSDRGQLRRLARRTWVFFEHYVGPEDNWLPPDHFQEAPLGVVAHRTSPTNIGLLLLSTAAAYDFGYESLVNIAIRLRNTFNTLALLERHQGHFLNWYHTRSLDPLPPRYISIVDNGNLAGCLVALHQSLADMAAQPILRWSRWQGMLDILGNLEEVMDQLEAPHLETVEMLRASLHGVQNEILSVRNESAQWIPCLLRLNEYQMPDLIKHLQMLVSLDGRDIQPGSLHRLRIYLDRVHHQMDDMQREVDTLAPWLKLFAQIPYILNAQIQQRSDLVEEWQTLQSFLSPSLTVAETPMACTEAKPVARTLATDLRKLATPEEYDVIATWTGDLLDALSDAGTAAQEILAQLDRVGTDAQTYVDEMDFGLLYSKQRDVFHIGFNVETGSLDGNYYDLLASEARIGSLVAIAKHDVPVKHWLHLGRPLTSVNGRRTLLSWSGTMFEYLMPSLLLCSPEHTLLHQTNESVVEDQMDYGRKHDIPWGVSESGYYHFDANMFYQYQAFGVPGLGFKRGLGDHQVIAPYASLLALGIKPRAVLDNLNRFSEMGLLGDYGLYEAIDFTDERLPMAKSQAIVRSFMVHHQGMILLSLSNYLQDDIMVQRFHADPRIRSVEMLLQEQIPLHAPLEELGEDESASQPVLKPRITAVPWQVSAQTPAPQVHYLSNGRYSLLVTNAGGGFSRWQETDLTRWRADTTRDDWGSWIYLRDQESGDCWSITRQPMDNPDVAYEVHFAPDYAGFSAQYRDLAARLEIRVASDDDVEIRRVRLTNQGDSPRRLTLTSYAELVLGDQRNDRRHPAFNKLFIESEYDADSGALLFRRRPRAADEEPIYLAHAIVLAGRSARSGSYETDRARFIGRNRTIHAPAAICAQNGSLSETTGSTLDPITAIRQEIELDPYETVELAYVTTAADSRYDALAQISRYSRWDAIERATTHAHAQAEQELRQLALEAEDLAQMQQLLSALIYPTPALRADAETLGANRLGQAGLWPYAISGDYPILLVRLQDDEGLPLLRQILRAHQYWRNRDLRISLVILNHEETGYTQELQGSVSQLLNRNGHSQWLNRRGGIFLLRADDLGEAASTLIQTAARAVLDQEHGSLEEQLAVLNQQPTTLPRFVPSDPNRGDLPTPPLARPTDLQFDNGMGGFSADGREYVIYRRPGQPTPAPWSNVIANPDFGFLMTESGSSFTWAGNSGENRLTPWSNDPVADPSGEALYLRDEETGRIWSPTPLPAGDDAPYLVRHGAGYSIFEHHSQGLMQQMRAFAPIDAPLKIVSLRLENCSERVRRITATYYAEWVLGVNRDEMQQYVVPDYDDGTAAMLAHNAYNAEFGECVAFLGASRPPHGLTTDRTEFLGRYGRQRQPVALVRIGLEGTVEAGVDPCAAYQVHLDLEPGEVVDVHFLLGQGEDREAAERLLECYQKPDQIARAWDEMNGFWNDLLGTVQVETPEPAMDLLLNRWLLYQNLVCRVWGRSAFYQSSGAYGFRDQLQDVMALVHTRPALAREQILRAAAHQFEAGDVLHWWHPPSGRGVRTRITDDLLWLPYVTAFYVATTGDHAILDEQIPFLTGKPLGPDEEERYGHYAVSQKRYSLYTHCLRAIDRGTTAGPHGLPLIGAGDWNDGMNRVGIEGQGESVWLAWFLAETLDCFASLCEMKREDDRAARYRRKASELRSAVDETAWDGDWYLRGFYDDGTPLGSSQNRECRIDAIAQSWAVFAANEPSAHARRAMQAVADRLVDENNGLIRLFTPPFDRTPHDPGYIKGYPPGVRENGGQYTHAALWTIWAFAKLGDGDRAVDLFQLINPIRHGATAEDAAQYCVEPYVVAADIYDAEGHIGRGGWTWYTGSAGWMFRLGIEGILGLKRRGDSLRMDPCIPAGWPSFGLTIRHGDANYRIRVENPDGVNRGVDWVALDGVRLEESEVLLNDDGQDHDVLVRLGRLNKAGENDADI